MILKSKLVLISHCLLFLLLFCSGCGIYSFTGITVDPDIKTISIQNIENSSGEGPANLTQLVTNGFKQTFQRNTNLTIIQREGDLQFEGNIVTFSLTPAAVQRTDQFDQASLNRLTLGVQVRYTNTKNSEENFDQLFSISQDFAANVDITQIPPSAIEEMTDRLVTEVLNKSLANW
ncbi:LPS assembly lipoprotein LptE [Botryobacter ruber]|uniref:LPS assembly lipoprotein LptE n=1 Tax=Botryobacter ruber TaxID=2171629 RepID=UPI000E0C61B3|nr:LptE family protein [Botryobacter ruber]